MMKKFILLSSTLSLFTGTVQADPAQGPEQVYKSVYNGQAPSLEDRVSQVTMKLSIELDFGKIAEDVDFSIPFSGCSATLIRPDIVLTAAHCFLEMAPLLKDGTLKPVIQYKDIRSGQLLTAEVSKTVAHPGFQMPVDLGGYGAPYDVALIKLKKPILDRQPVALYSSDTLPKRFYIRIAGWGRNHFKDPNYDADPVIKAITSEVEKLDSTNPADVKRAGVLFNKLLARMKEIDQAYRPLLAGYKTAQVRADKKTQRKYLVMDKSPVSICKGDSGGPSFVETAAGLYQVGIHSTGLPSNCDRVGFKGKATRLLAPYEAYDTYIPQVHSWIIQNIEALK